MDTFLGQNINEETTLANPASVYCEQQGGTLEIVDETGGQVGMCTLSDGTVCEEWAYMRGECPVTGTIETVTWALNSPVEFSITDSKYEISLVWDANIFEVFQNNDIPGKEFDWLVIGTDPKCSIKDSNTLAYKERNVYYIKLFSVYQPTDQEREYLIRDETLISKYESNPDNYGWIWIHIYVIANKMWYTNMTDFAKDFTRYCSIRPRIPIAMSKNYLIFSDACDNWAMDVLWCDQATIDDIINKIIVK